MTSLELYTKGAQVWISHPIKVWIGAVVLEDYRPDRKTIEVVTEEDEKRKLVVNTEKDLPFLRNPAILIGENDLTCLSYLHEPAVLHNLQVRFCQNRNIYTYCGIVLVAINPYDEPPIYDNDTIQAYRGKAMGDLDPHIFAVAEEAYMKLEREQRDQSIIVSGESGAGKTVSAKYTMRYFATVGGCATETQIERKVLASSPIMEAIGNAKTTRNDNSSRFGKFIELQFDKQFHISGASMRTYLLEKSRVVSQAPDERNYHIFYQLCSARKSLAHLQLDHQDNFHYLNQGNSPTVDGIDDLAGFDESVTAMTTLGFDSEDQLNILKILAAVLHLGNIAFAERVEKEQIVDGCVIPPANKHSRIFSELLEVDEDKLRYWLCFRRFVSMRDVFEKPVSIEDAAAARDALAKHIYAALFNWIVLAVNKELESNTPRHKFIGVLDIYGFETFEINSFEQFCINYANEKLQQQFNLHVFKLEQEEYIKEGIEWSMIDFYDNQPCIDLIEAKLGVLDLLDEECRMPKGSDSSWTEKLYSKCSKYSHFSKARFGQSNFVIKHFADKVQYDSNGFLEKNRDTVIQEQVDVIRSSQNSLVKRLFATGQQKLAPGNAKVKIKAAETKVAPTKTQKKTIGSQFRDSLNLLMSTLNDTTPHYVRCIKPNETKSAFEYNPMMAVQQLRACGVIETVRISAAGFPSRWSYIDFFYRYRVLCKSTDINRSSMQRTCENILKQHIKSSSEYQFGKTKIFFRAGQVAYLEKLRSTRLRQCCIMLQKMLRGWICRQRYLKTRKSAVLLQRYGRGLLARRLAEQLRRTRAAIVIQCYVRGWLERNKYNRLKICVVGIQKHARGYLARLRFLQIKYNTKAIIIQKHVRGWLARREYQKRNRQIVICQAAIRRFLARRLYKRLRIEARSIEHVKKLNKGLENKIISQQQKINELIKSNTEMKNCHNEVIELKTKMQTFKAMEIEIKNLNNLLVDKNKSIARLEEELRSEKEEKVDVVNELEKLRLDARGQQQLWAEETVNLRRELENINEIVKTTEKGAEEHLRARLEEEKMQIIRESDCDREAYQRLLEQYNNLEKHCEELNGLLERSKKGSHERNASDVSSISNEYEDSGQGSIRTSASNADLRNAADIKREDSIEQQKPELDLALVLKLQHKLAEVEREKERLQKRLDDLDLSPKVERHRSEAESSIRIAELEVMNSELRNRLADLQRSIIEGTGLVKLQEELLELRKELDRKTEENIQLKSIMATNMKSMMNSKTRTGEYINEDGELAQAYETQKTINKQLELELQDEIARFKAHEREYKVEIEKLRDDNERLQRILSANLAGSPQSQAEAYVKHEIARLAAENLDLIDKNSSLAENLRKLKRQVKVLMGKFKAAGMDVDDSIVEGGKGVTASVAKQGPNIRKKDREYLGMFSFRSGDENAITKQLVIDLKPRTAVTLLPGLPAYITFMCVRHTDYINDEEQVKNLLSSFNNAVKKVIRKRHEDFETNTLWLANTLRLVHNMKQYSGDQMFQQNNTKKQNEQCLRNFDLSEFRQLLSDTAYWIYRGVIKNFQAKIQQLIVPAVLEHEEIPGICGNKPSAFWRRTLSQELGSPTASEKPTVLLLQELTNNYKIMTFYGVDPEVISQTFKQVYYFICASSLNNLLLRKELCHWSKGFQIRHNLSHLEMWTKEKNLDEKLINQTLQPIIQAAHLLQARKTDEDVDSICDICSALTPLQISKILNLYTPVDEYEQPVPASFIKKVQAKLQQREDAQSQQSLLMDLAHVFAVKFPFKPSSICLEDIEIPESLGLRLLEKV